MKTDKTLVFIVVCAVSAAILVGFAHYAKSADKRAASSQINWQPSYDSAFAQAEHQHKLIMVDTYTDWCVWCKRLDSDVYPDPAVVDAVDQVSPVKINAEKEGVDLAAKYNVTSYPTVLFLDTNGNLIHQINGFEPAPQFAAEVTQVVKDQNDLPALESLTASNPGDVSDTIKLAQIMVHRGETAATSAVVTKLEADGQGAHLIDLYNALGDADAASQDLPDAEALYSKVLAQPRASTNDQIRAHVGLLNCYVPQNDAADVKLQLAEIIAMPHVSDDQKTQAQAMLTQIDTNGLSSLSD